jgi:hypothetical protein
MPKSGINKQICSCSARAIVSVRIYATSLRVAPRVTTESITVYLCDRCARKGMRPAARELVLESVNGAAGAIAAEVHAP